MTEKRKINLDVDYKIPAHSNANQESDPIKISAGYIHHAVMSTHPQGLEGQMRRIFGRLQRKMDQAIETKQGEIELEEAEADLLRKSFETCLVPAEISRTFIDLESAIEAATKR
jgi:hypothetical protein